MSRFAGKPSSKASEPFDPIELAAAVRRVAGHACPDLSDQDRERLALVGRILDTHGDALMELVATVEGIKAADDARRRGMPDTQQERELAATQGAARLLDRIGVGRMMLRRAQEEAVEAIGAGRDDAEIDFNGKPDMDDPLTIRIANAALARHLLDLQTGLMGTKLGMAMAGGAMKASKGQRNWMTEPARVERIDHEGSARENFAVNVASLTGWIVGKAERDGARRSIRQAVTQAYAELAGRYDLKRIKPASEETIRKRIMSGGGGYDLKGVYDDACRRAKEGESRPAGLVGSAQ